MIQQMIRLKSVSEIQHFIQAVDSAPYIVELYPKNEQEYIFPATSVIGICSLGLGCPLILNADTTDRQSVYETFHDYIISY